MNQITVTYSTMNESSSLGIIHFSQTIPKKSQFFFTSWLLCEYNQMRFRLLVIQSRFLGDPSPRRSASCSGHAQLRKRVGGATTAHIRAARVTEQHS